MPNVNYDSLRFTEKLLGARAEVAKSPAGNKPFPNSFFTYNSFTNAGNYGSSIYSYKIKRKPTGRTHKLLTSCCAVNSAVENYKLHVTVEKVQHEDGLAATDAHLPSPHESLASGIPSGLTTSDAKDVLMSMDKSGFRGKSVSKKRHHIVPSFLKPIEFTLSSTPVTHKEDAERRSANFANVSSIQKVHEMADAYALSEVDKYLQKLRLEAGCDGDNATLSSLSIVSAAKKGNELAETDCLGTSSSALSLAMFGQEKTISNQCLPESCHKSTDVESGADIFPRYASMVKALQAMTITDEKCKISDSNRLTNKEDVQPPTKEKAKAARIAAPTFLNKILELCGQTGVLTWKEAFPGRELSTLSSSRSCWSTPNLLRLYGVRCVKGKYPKELLHAWDQFALNGHMVNDRPEKFTAGQHYVLICTENGGVTLEDFKYRTHEQAISVFKQLVYTLAILEKITLEDFKLRSAKEAESVLKQITITLAILERTLKFEHRDLHVSNILVKRTTADSVDYLVGGNRLTVDSAGLLCYMVDFTLSRLQIGDQVIFTDLSSHSGLFDGSGDDQFDVYRSMRDVIGNSWANFNPKTNVLWVAYLVNYFLSAKYCNRRLRKEQKRRLFALKRRTNLWRACSDEPSFKALFSE
ncbi:hypothetical protein M513_08077 [Trichuris suis]|uniref:non-specific serine/threonine protein kinase n=1 Tax=Trichuris suis TaxID=68888 RepID=A0A085M1E0_9BILA|nr:hypothetical protein M513_08077 [Trichuris suis]